MLSISILIPALLSLVKPCSQYYHEKSYAHAGAGVGFQFGFGFSFGGGFGSRMRGRSGVTQTEPFYSVSANVASYDQAQYDCNLVFKNGKLLNIETEDEMDKIKELLLKYGDTGIYHIGGYYDEEKQGWFWEPSNQPVTDGSDWKGKKKPWAKDLEGTPTSDSRMFLEHVSLSRTVFKFGDKSELKKYICETLGNGTVSPCDNSNSDIIIGLDISFTMRGVLEPAAKLINDLMLIFMAFEGNRIAMFMYTDTEAFWVFSFKDNISREEMSQRILEVRYNGSAGEDHGFAISTAVDEYIENPRKNMAKTQSIVIFSDGQTEPDQDPMETAQAFINQGFHIYTVFMKSEFIEEEPGTRNSLSIVGGKEDHIFNEDELQELMAKMCGKKKG